MSRRPVSPISPRSRPPARRASAGSAAVSTVVVESLVRPEALVEIEVVAGQPPGLVRIPQLLPLDDAGAVVAPGDFVGQCEWVLEEAGRRLAAHGLGLGDVVKVVQQTTPATRRQYRDTAEARRRLLGPAFPSSTGVLVSALPHPEALVGARRVGVVGAETGRALRRGCVRLAHVRPGGDGRRARVHLRYHGLGPVDR